MTIENTKCNHFIWIGILEGAVISTCILSQLMFTLKIKCLSYFPTDRYGPKDSD